MKMKKWIKKGGFVKTKRIIAFAVILVIIATSVVIYPSLTRANWFGAGKTGSWNYRQKITIDHRKVADTDASKGETNFPVLISTTNVTFKSIANGGHVGLDTGYDIVFTTGDGKTKLAHEIEKYDATTGQIIAWVKVPKVASDVNTTLYMYYGNAAETGNEQNVAGVWDSNYKGVWHLPNTPSLTAGDSTGVNNGTITGATAFAGQVDGGASFTSATHNINTGNNSSLDITGRTITVSAWINPTDYGSNSKGRIFQRNTGLAAGYLFYIQNAGGSPVNALMFGVNGVSSDGVNFGYANNAVTLGTWQYVTVVYAASGDLRFYVNGTQKTTTSQLTEAITTASVNAYIGNQSDNTRNFNGKIDELRVSTSIRTPDWIKTEYNNQSSPSTFETFGGEETQPTAQVKGGWYNSSWTYRKKLTIDKTKVSTVSGTTNTNFPVLVSMTDASLKSIANGGHMASSTAADLVFTDSSGTVKLNHEIEKYDPATGQIIAWVQIPTLSPSADTDIYLYYGNSSVSVSQANPTGVWDANYKGVWHLPDGNTLSATDSTSNSVNGTIGTVTASNTGKIDGAASFAGSATTDSIDFGNKMKGIASFTIEVWAKPHGDGSSVAPFMEVGQGSTAKKGLYLMQNTGTSQYEITGKVATTTGTTAVTSDSSHKLTADAWNFVTMTYDDSGDRKIYLYNNALQFAVSSAVTGTLADDTSSSFIWRTGTTPSTGFSKYQGDMDEIRVSSIVRSQDWLVTSYNNQNDPSVGGFYKSKGNEELVPQSNWYQAWGYRKKVIINHTQVSGTSILAAFPVLVSVSADALLKSTANGGHVASSTAADIMFTSADGSTKIPHEIEKYDPATGQLIVWVKTNVSPATDTILYMYYGNPNVTVSQEDKTNVWSNGYAGVWHLPNGTALTANDSTSNANNSTSIDPSVTATTGQIDGGANFTGGDRKGITGTGNWPTSWTSLTYSTWFKVTNTSEERISFQSSSSNTGWGIAPYLSGHPDFYARTIADNSFSNLTTTINKLYYLTVTYTGGTAIAYLYNATDGTSASQTLTGLTSPNNGDGSFYIGRYDNSTTYSMIGMLDETRVSSVVRTPDWIRTEYNNQNTPTSFVTLAGEESSIKTTVNTTWYSSDYGYRKKITIDHRKVSGSTALTDFPVLVSISGDSSLKFVSNGGLVASSTGGDLLFTDSTGKNKLSYEIESYSPTTGQLLAWVKTPSLSPSADTSVYLYFGNSVIATMQANSTGVWSNSFAGVWHLPNGTSLSASDSLGVNNGSFSTPAPVATAGKIDGAAGFNGSSNNIIAAQQIFSSTDATAPYTGSAWIKTSYAGANGQPIILQYVSGQTNRFVFYVTNFSGDVGKVSYFKNGGNMLTSVIKVNDGNLHYVAFTKTSAKTVTLFIDGVQSGSTVTDNTAMYATQTAIGGATGANFFNGTIDEVHISSIDRTPDWIKTEYNNQSSPASFFYVGELEVENRASGKAGIGAVSRGASSVWTAPSAGAWTSRKKIIINHAKVAGKTALSDFPVLVSLTDADWKTTANGGHMGKADGTDLYFTSSDGSTKLAHEIETYSPTTGALVAWVKIPSLSPTTDTTLYMYYGNASASDMQTVAPAKALVWSNGYAGVWHFGNGSSLSAGDSTGQNNGTLSGATPPGVTTGKVDGAASFDGASSIVNLASDPPIGAVTFSSWINPTSVTGTRSVIGKMSYWGNTTYGYGLEIESGSIVGLAALADTNWRSSLNYPISAGNWYAVNFTVTGQGAGQIGKLYVNGTLVKSYTGTASNWGAYAFGIGASHSGASTGDYFSGVIDESRVSNVVRSADWIKTEYNNQNSPSTFYTLGQKDSSARASSTPLMKLRGNGIQFR